MVAITTGIVRKFIFVNRIWFGYNVVILWYFERDIKTLEQNLETIFGVIHQRIRGGIP